MANDYKSPHRFENVGYFIRGCLAFLFICITLVSCDLSIVDTTTNEPVFETASDFIRTSKCGTFYQKQPAHLVVSTPLYTCEDPIESPPGPKLQRIYSALKAVFLQLFDIFPGVNLKKELEDPPWVLITGAEESQCSYHLKLRNAARAGYSAVVLLAPNTISKKIFNESVSRDRAGIKGPDTILDVHLVNSWDTKELLKYAGLYKDSRFIKPFGILSTPLVSNRNCMPHRKRTSRPPTTWAGKENFGIAASIYGAVVTTGLLIKELCMVLLEGTSIFSFCLVLVLAPLATLAFLMDNNFFLFRDSAEHEPEQPNRERREPPRENIGGTVAEYRQILNIPPDARLTVRLVESAFRMRARDEHPDRHPPERQQRQNEVFNHLSNVKDFLLRRCDDYIPR